MTEPGTAGERGVLLGAKLHVPRPPPTAGSNRSFAGRRGDTRRLAAAPTRARIATSHAMDAPTWPHRLAAPSVPDVRITRDRTAQMTASPARYQIAAHRRGRVGRSSSRTPNWLVRNKCST